MSTHWCFVAFLNQKQMKYILWYHLISFRRWRGMRRGGRRYGIEAEKEERVREAGVRGGQERGRRVREGKRSE